MDVTRKSSESAKREVGSKGQPESKCQKDGAEYDEESTQWGEHEVDSEASDESQMRTGEPAFRGVFQAPLPRHV